MSETRAPSVMLPFAERTRLLLPGVYAWLLTVELPAHAPTVGRGARLCSLLALAALVAALLAGVRRLELARILGIHVFVGLCVLTWALIGSELPPAHLDRIRVALGMLGWVLYSFGWGRLRPPLAVESEAHIAPGAPLIPRSRLHRRSVPVAVFAVLAALALEALAFRVDRPEHAVLAHATAAACALVILQVGSRVALAQGSRLDLSSAPTRLNAVAVRGAVLAVLFGVGLVWAALK